MCFFKALLFSCCVMGACATRAAAEEECGIPNEPGVSFLPKTTPPKDLMPLPKPGEELPKDCPFYQHAWQTFLFVTQLDDGKPAFLKYPTFEDVFKIKASPLFSDKKRGLLSLAPRNTQYPNTGIPPDMRIADLEQAGLQWVLVDQNGNAVWYAIHVNNEFVRFLHDYNLTDPNVLKQIPAELEFRSGVLELKSAWQIVEGSVPKNYITTRATIPVFKINPDGKIVKDGIKPRTVTVALLSLHVVGVIEGHPEFIWATFEHVSHRKHDQWVRDVAPAAKLNPDANPVSVETEAAKYPLYPVDPKSNSAPPVAGANTGSKFDALTLDEKNQKFSPKTLIYRIFPASKSDGTEEDDEIKSLNDRVRELFQKLGMADKDVRSNYQLVGAIWLNKPRDAFKVGTTFPDKDASLFGGEDRLSNMAMESFTQTRNPHCFSCHDTSNVTGPNSNLPMSKLNVSHVLSKFFDLTRAKP